MSKSWSATHRNLLLALWAGVSLCTSCGPVTEGADPQPSAPKLDGSFVVIPRALSTEEHQQLNQTLGQSTTALKDELSETFYLALRKSELGQRYFLSAYLKQNVPEQIFGPGGSSLGLRVVSFRVQNDKLFVFNVDDTRLRSEVFAPEELIEAWPLVTGNTAFNRLPNADQYVLFDPSAGMDRLGAVDSMQLLYGPRFEVELAFAQRFRQLGDGISFEKVFSGRGFELFPPESPWGTEPSTYHVSGTLGLALRRYHEGAGYTPTPLPPTEFYFRSEPRLVPDSGGLTEQVATKWNLRPGMQPITWILSDSLQKVQQDPRFKGYDVIGAVKRGVEGWNAAFGFQALTTRFAKPGESFADDDKNFIIVDPDPTYTFAFADRRTNPNTGEVRGASVYISISWLEHALLLFEESEAAVGGASRPLPSLGLAWNTLAPTRLCELPDPLDELAQTGSRELSASLTPKEKVEHYFTYAVLHEVGHTLGLRHNFKGSLSFPSHSVMEYSQALERPYRDTPGPYDVSAIRYLYGISSVLPQEPFCTDEDSYEDPDCNRFDATPTPLSLFYGASYHQALLAALARGTPLPSNTLLNGVLQYLRASPRSDVRLTAWNIAMEGIRAPLSPEAVASSPSYAATADAMSRRVLQRLFLDAGARGVFSADPPEDPLLTPAIREQLRANLLNVDGVRSPATRRVVVDILKKQQRYESYAILREARVALEASLPGLSGEPLLAAEDLASRIKQATSPYFN